MNPGGAQPSISNMVMMMGLMYVGGTITIDGEGMEDRRMILYVCAAVVHIVQLLALFYAYKMSEQNNDRTVVNVPPQKVMGQDVGEAKTMTVKEYDRSKIMEDLNQLLIGACIVGFITYKWDSHRPLMLNTMFAVNNALDKPLFKIYVLGKPAVGPLARPWTAPSMNPFGNLMGGGADAAAAPAPAAAAAARSGKANLDNEDEGPATPLTPNEIKRIEEGKAALAAEKKKFEAAEKNSKKGGKGKPSAATAAAIAAAKAKEQEDKQEDEEEQAQESEESGEEKRSSSQDDDVVIVASDEGEEETEKTPAPAAAAETAEEGAAEEDEEKPAKKDVRKRTKSARAE